MLLSFLVFKIFVHASVINHDQSNLFVHNTSFHIFRVMHACIICIAIHKVKYFFPNLFSRDKYGRSIGSSNQCHREYSRRFGHDIREVKKHLARLTSLFEDYIKTQVVHSQTHHPCQFNRSLDHSSKPRAIYHVELIAPTCGNQCL